MKTNYYHPHYVQKEDVLDYVKKQHMGEGITVVASSIINLLLYFWLVPDISNIYLDFTGELPQSVQIIHQLMPILIGVLAIYGISKLFSQPDLNKVQAALTKYKAGEMINVRKLPLKDMQAYILLFIGINVGLVIFAIIFPIYSLTSSF